MNTKINELLQIAESANRINSKYLLLGAIDAIRDEIATWDRYLGREAKQEHDASEYKNARHQAAAAKLSDLANQQTQTSIWPHGPRLGSNSDYIKKPFCTCAAPSWNVAQDVTCDDGNRL